MQTLQVQVCRLKYMITLHEITLNNDEKYNTCHIHIKGITRNINVLHEYKIVCSSNNSNKIYNNSYSKIADVYAEAGGLCWIKLQSVFFILYLYV